MAENDDELEIFKCHYDNCDETFSKRLELHQHLFYVHTKLEPQCPICQAKFISIRKLRIHEKTHGDYVCPICQQRFNEKYYLRTHMVVHEENRPRFNCNLCDKSFLFKGNLSVHVRTKHKNERFVCFKCNRKLTTKQKLDEHFAKMHMSSQEDIVISVKDLEDISSEEEENGFAKEECETEYDQAVNRIKSNFYLKKQDNFNETGCYSLSKENFEMLLDEDFFNC
ncbi:PR domain zinc finger 5 [Brachionus plicatilis]|uniref:PR domain zinc finger 5 n=1 Tax=Brachionus plicatilis TaxID=10195 RepID=A0A3M7QT65_BRAPC|nr:PR domain zinc finger 5 [Brachionus plicatilis]